jgi:hypothetical protein
MGMGCPLGKILHSPHGDGDGRKRERRKTLTSVHGDEDGKLSSNTKFSADIYYLILTKYQ